MDSFEKKMTDALVTLKNSNDILFLKNELSKTEKSLPECAAESFYRTNKLSIIKERLGILCPGFDKAF